MQAMKKIERFPVVIDGITHMMTDEQIGNLEVDITPEQIEAMKLEIARERGEPEPVLYQDESPDLYEPRPEEVILDQIVELQERMAKGMKVINEAKEKLALVKGKIVHAHAGKANRIPYVEYCALLKARDGWNDRISALWDHWFTLKAQCDQLIGDNRKIWAMYFGLKDEVINPRFINGNTDRIDNQLDLYQDAAQLAAVLAESHILDMKKYSR